MEIKQKIIFRENLKSLISEKGCTQHYLAKKLNINKSTLHNYLNGVLPQGLSTTIKLSEYFNLSLDEIIFGKQNEDQSNNLTEQQSTENKYEVTIKKIT